MDEFASPESNAPAGGREYGQLNVGVAVSEGVGAVLANIPQIVAVGLVSIVITVASLLMCCVPALLVVPPLTWGLYAFMLEVLDGKGRFGTLFSGFNQFGTSLGRMWGYFILMFLLYIPAAIVAVGLVVPDVMAQIETGTPPSVLGQSLKMGAPTLLWSFVMVRFMIAPFLIVERDQGPFQALQTAWEATSRHWTPLIALQLLLVLLSMPGQIFSVGGQMYGEQFQQDPAATLEAFPITFGLIMLGSLVTSVTSFFGMMFYASAYRQITGPAPTSAG